mgnify:CR=1 FL=1
MTMVNTTKSRYYDDSIVISGNTITYIINTHMGLVIWLVYHQCCYSTGANWIENVIYTWYVSAT